MGRRYIKNRQKTNKHGIPIGLRDIEEIVDEAERKEKTKRESFLESIKPEVKKELEENYSGLYKKKIANIYARKHAQEVDEKRKIERLKVITKMQEEDSQER